MAREYKEPTFKKMVTSTYETGTKKVKYDFGFAETIRWISTKWSNPTHYSRDDNREDIIVRMKDGEVKKLCYGSGMKIAAEYATSHRYDGVQWPYKEKENLLFTVDDPVIIVSDYAYGDKFFTINILSNYDAEVWADTSMVSDVHVYY